MKTVLEVINLSVEFLASKGIKNSRRDVLDLFSHVLGVRPLDLYVQFDRPLQETELSQFRSHLLRRAKGEPYQYISGKVDFFDCQLTITKDVIIPRQETEILVDKIAKHLAGESLEGKVLWDLCCGSGCIGIALKKRFPELTVVSSDISPEALAVAIRNADQNQTEVIFRQGDLLAPFAGEQAHYVVCNPPYVSEDEFPNLEIEVRDFEPKRALVAEDSGLAFYKRLALQLKNHLHLKSRVWLEIGHLQGQAVKEIFGGGHYGQSQLLQDWSGHDRFFLLENE
jgi:release factor glutamine methyltransferase